MALTIGEASAVNTVLRFVAQDAGYRGAVPTSSEALTAANLLAQKAHKALGAGYSGTGDVAKVWPPQRP